MLWSELARANDQILARTIDPQAWWSYPNLDHLYHWTLNPYGDDNDLRVLGSPNPGQSFGRELWGPQATRVTVDPRGTWAAKTWKKMIKNRSGSWNLAGSGTVTIWHRGREYVDFSFVFFVIQFFGNCKNRSGSWNSAATWTVSSWVPTSTPNRHFWTKQYFFETAFFFSNFINRSGSWHLVASGPATIWVPESALS